LDRWEEEELEDKLRDLDRTEWFDPSVNPVHVGRYEVTTVAWDFPQYCDWNGKTWSRWEGDDLVVTKWRGLTEEYWDAAAALDKIIEDSKA